jgi:arginyl-tRNA synthetase
MTPEQLSAAIRDVLRAHAQEIGIPPEALTVAVGTVERPRNRDHGDWATNAALQLARPAGVAPRALAERISPLIAGIDGVSAVDIAGPGFLNITLTDGAAGELARSIVRAADGFGRLAVLHGQRINIEFISANPTGPLHLGHTRWAAVGDAIARVLDAAGAEVVREFYVNDRGVQMDRFGVSVQARALGTAVPEDGYHGAYVQDIADQVVASHPEIAALPEDERVVAFREAAYALQLQQHKDVLDGFNTHFDVWSSERALHDSGAVDRGLARLLEQGHVVERDGATWLNTSEFGDDKDRVLIKADGEMTYFASDTAYYVDKRSRGFDRCIYLLGADHHGYVARLRAVAACAGDDPDASIEVLIGQMVKMMKGGAEVRLSKRAGNIITLEDLVEEVGVDAARYSLIRYPADSPLVLDLDLLVQRTNDNPVFYVQYAHARICSMLRNATELGVVTADSSAWDPASFDPSLLSHDREGELLAVLGQYPGIVASAAELREPHRIARHLEEVATAYHRFYDACRVLPQGDEAATALTTARLWLCAAARQVLANGLDLLGVSAPERM